MGDLVSVIVPVYNVAPYLDECMESIVAQTHKNLEILLVNDGSTDNSPTICRKWEAMDKRIRYFSKKNEGPGPTRNFAMVRATGEYVVCVDSDDWLDKSFVEKLYNAISLQSADMAECDFWRVAVNSGLKTYNQCSQVMGREFLAEERIIWGRDSICKTMVRREFIIQNHIEQPNVFGEDGAVYPMMVVLARSIASVYEPLYYYRKKRPLSISNTKEKVLQYPAFIRYVIDTFKQRNLFLDNEDVLRQYILRAVSRGMVPIIHQISSKEYATLRTIYTDILSSNFSSYKHHATFLMGSYNLTQIMIKTCTLEDPYFRFNFTSIPAIMSDRHMLMSDLPTHKNPYRAFMLQREFQGSFINMLDKFHPDYIVIDLIEERHDLLEVDGSYFTLSDALQESDYLIKRGRIIRRDSEECHTIWEDSCRRLIALLQERLPADHVIIIANTLAERHGNIYHSNSYAELDAIRKINAILKSYYTFFCTHFEGIQCIDMTNDDLFITDDLFEYGCYPWHLNDLINQKIADAINFE